METWQGFNAAQTPSPPTALPNTPASQRNREKSDNSRSTPTHSVPCFPWPTIHQNSINSVTVSLFVSSAVIKRSVLTKRFTFRDLHVADARACGSPSLLEELQLKYVEVENLRMELRQTRAAREGDAKAFAEQREELLDVPERAADARTKRLERELRSAASGMKEAQQKAAALAAKVAPPLESSWRLRNV